MRGIERPAVALAVLTGLNVLNYLDRFMGAALLPKIIEDLRLSDAQGGSLQSVFILIYSIVSPVVGWLGDRQSRLRLAALGVVIWSAATFASGLMGTFAALLFVRALVGVGEASYAVVTPSLISDLYPSQRRARALAIFYAAIPVGTAAGYMLGGWIGTAYGWRPAFFVAGGPGLAFALGLLLLREPPRGRYDAVKSAPTEQSLRESLHALWSRRSYVYNTAAQVLWSFTMGGLATWMPTYFLRERHLPLERATFIFGALLVVAGFLGTIVGGQLGDRAARRGSDAPFLFSGAALLASLPFTAIAVLSPHPAIFWPAMFVTLLLLFVNIGPLNAAMANVLPPDLRGRGFGVNTVAIHLLGDALSPTLIGIASGAVGLRVPVLVSGLLAGTAGLVLLAGRGALARDLGAAGA